ncbi:MAG: 16S rRNA processing protein RimM [Firmicutes bacterium]|nr:16S rRNA processing protein RimM [Clostridiales bacterium]MBR3375284.1 16S rRNA processing protein RimM [Bacillota bacterium]MBR6225325.1 16S rRNA processing protein RimM [Bacillota bacterium]MBR6956459.1 16S rRNA processing protein RimM [Bacillota bacterium]
MEKIKIAKIVNAVGLKGEVKVYNYSDVRERFEELDEIIISGKKQESVKKILNVRYQGNMVILSLEGIDDRNKAEAVKDFDVYITEDDLKELPEDTFYVRDLIGMKVIDEGEYGEIGTLKDVLQNTSQDVYVVRTAEGRDVLIPAVKDFIRSVDQEKGVITTTLIPGFIDEGPEA